MSTSLVTMTLTGTEDGGSKGIPLKLEVEAVMVSIELTS